MFNGMPYPGRQLPAEQMAEIVKETEEIVREIIAMFSNKVNLGPVVPTISEIVALYKIEKAFTPPQGPGDKELLGIVQNSIETALENCSCSFMLPGIISVEMRHRLFAN